ncbi:5-formyltetrahydrofolate cyclo-ligase [Sphingomonas edaphi]|uniref:5-formyltetrahydrofolate cyclo-ligase n=1 Tax=Sphingomonas edaphi TaxID=2315689 RepID=A0A418Q1S8_9SPHN|nr:5-formyltetrahydrofolate cyclo-ligase [Sphingomonas edaphi]RIX31784.1 5-formyltetrahydrofolate cyclo-ligase [Sphingomonas edaphi]
MVVPSLPLPANKVALRRLARERRKTFVEDLDLERKSQLELALVEHLRPLLEKARIIGGYCPMTMEISPLPALEIARQYGGTIAYPAFANRLDPFRFLEGKPTSPGPWSVDQPALSSPAVYPDLVLLPLLAIDRKGTRLGQGKGHYDRVVGDLRRRGAQLIGVGWEIQLIEGEIPADAWDIPLDGFGSPSGLELFR